MRTQIMMLAAFALVGCRQARVSDEGVVARDVVMGDAVAKAGNRASAVSPTQVPEQTKGLPMTVSPKP